MFSARKIALLAVVAVQANAFADGEKTDKELQKSVIPYGLIQAYSNLADTQSAGNPEFQLANVRFGLKVSEGITRAQFETQILGNVGPEISATNGINGVSIRRADVGLALPSNTTFSLGRTRLGGADAWGMDATITVDQFSWMDGASVVQKLSLGGKDELSLSLGLGNSMGFPGGRDSRVFGKTLKTDRGVIAGTRVSYQGVVAAAFFGMEKNQVQQEPGASEPVFDAEGAKSTTTFVKTERKITARDVSHFEGSLGYNRDNWALGGWYQSIVRSKLNVVTSVSKGKFETTAAVDEPKFAVKASNKTTDVTLGLGFNGDSQLFGVGNLLQKGDLITYGFSTSQVSKRDDSIADSDESKQDQTQFVIGAGYAAGGFQVELGHELSTANDKVFTDKDGKSVNKSSNRTYLVGIYSF
jgi:hypothetical protein